MRYLKHPVLFGVLTLTIFALVFAAVLSATFAVNGSPQYPSSLAQVDEFERNTTWTRPVTFYNATLPFCEEVDNGFCNENNSTVTSFEKRTVLVKCYSAYYKLGQHRTGCGHQPEDDIMTCRTIRGNHTPCTGEGAIALVTIVSLCVIIALISVICNKAFDDDDDPEGNVRVVFCFYVMGMLALAGVWSYYLRVNFYDRQTLTNYNERRVYDVTFTGYDGEARDTMIYFVPSLNRSYATEYKGSVGLNDTLWFDRGVLTNSAFHYDWEALRIMTGVLVANVGFWMLVTCYFVYYRGSFSKYWHTFENREMPYFVCPDRNQMYVYQGRVIRTSPDRRHRYFEVCDPEQRLQRFEKDAQVRMFGTGEMPQISWCTWHRYCRRAKPAPRL